MAIKHKEIGHQLILYQDTLDTKVIDRLFDLSLFNPQQLKASHQIVREAAGRGKSYFFNEGSNQWVLRHYWRGGLISKCVKDAYLWRSLETSRPYKEFALLYKFTELNLPAPMPIAARLVRHQFYYQADIITEAIAQSESLVQRLKKPTADSLWDAIGKTIKGFHDQRIYHDDLNAHNILINKNNDIFLIDFDKGKQVSKSIFNWKQSNLSRLLRSLEKEKKKGTILYFDPEHWKRLLDSYNSSL